jgi:hypothetical protein
MMFDKEKELQNLMGFLNDFPRVAEALKNDINSSDNAKKGVAIYLTRKFIRNFKKILLEIPGEENKQELMQIIEAFGLKGEK